MSEHEFDLDGTVPLPPLLSAQECIAWVGAHAPVSVVAVVILGADGRSVGFQVRTWGGREYAGPTFEIAVSQAAHGEAREREAAGMYARFMTSPGEYA